VIDTAAARAEPVPHVAGVREAHLDQYEQPVVMSRRNTHSLAIALCDPRFRGYSAVGVPPLTAILACHRHTPARRYARERLAFDRNLCFCGKNATLFVL
jgi:hypothetical protein